MSSKPESTRGGPKPPLTPRATEDDYTKDKVASSSRDNTIYESPKLDPATASNRSAPRSTPRQEKPGKPQPEIPATGATSTSSTQFTFTQTHSTQTNTTTNSTGHNFSHLVLKGNANGVQGDEFEDDVSVDPQLIVRHDYSNASVEGHAEIRQGNRYVKGKGA